MRDAENFNKNTEKRSLKRPSKNKTFVSGLYSLNCIKFEILQSYFHLQCYLNFQVLLCSFCSKFHGLLKKRHIRVIKSKTYRTQTPEKYKGFNIIATSKVALVPVSLSQEQYFVPPPLTIILAIICHSKRFS